MRIAAAETMNHAGYGMNKPFSELQDPENFWLKSKHNDKKQYLTYNQDLVPTQPGHMKKTAMVFGFFVVSIAAESQSRIIDSIVDEGHLLYRLEMASWYGTELILKKHKEQAQKIGGSFSYEINNTVNCVFFSREEAPKVIAAISFDTSFNTAKATVNVRERAFTQYELNVYTIRKLALEEIDKDSLFSIYENTSFNVIPIVDSSYRKVYVTTSPEVKGVVLFGNDYLLQFNHEDSLLSKRSLHGNMIPVDFGKDTDPELIETFHVHTPEAGKYISPTDICALMLYGRFAKWKQHMVMSKTHVSLWDMENNDLIVLTKEQWSKQNGNKKLVGVVY